MNPTSEVIKRQLENEGVHIYKLWSTHFVDFGKGRAQICLGDNRDQPKAVEDAIKTTLRVGGLLAKYHDAITSGETGTLGDLLVNEDEREIL